MKLGWRVNNGLSRYKRSENVYSCVEHHSTKCLPPRLHRHLCPHGPPFVPFERRKNLRWLFHPTRRLCTTTVFPSFFPLAFFFFFSLRRSIINGHATNLKATLMAYKTVPHVDDESGNDFTIHFCVELLYRLHCWT